MCLYPRASAMLYVSTDSWQTRFHNSAPVRVLQGVLSMGPVPRPRRLDFFLASSPTVVGVKWLTSRQQRKWLMAAERLETSTPCQDISTRLKFTFESRPASRSLHIFEVCKHGKNLERSSVKSLIYLEKVVEHSSRWSVENFTHGQSLFETDRRTWC